MNVQTTYPTPVLNKPDFTHCFRKESAQTLILDDQELMRSVEMILLPGSHLNIVEELPNHIRKITTPLYPGENLYIDERFLKIRLKTPQTHLSLEHPPSVDEICKTLRKLQGLPYLWGGNWPKPIKEMLHLYPSSALLPKKEQKIWQLEGMDCSGLLYYATFGYTPRNTFSLVTYGTALPIKGLQEQELFQMIKPLDLIVWQGHVVIALDNKTLIESTPKEGVHVRNLSERLQEISEKRKPVNQYSSFVPSFIICRWHPKPLGS